MRASESFWDASLADLKQGFSFVEASDSYVCLVCGEAFERGVVYPHEGVFYEAYKYAGVHVADAHGSMFEYLLGLDKKWTGLTDLQKRLLQLFREGRSDNEIVAELDAGSASTVRNHRFALRERMKQAKLFLAVMELASEKTTRTAKLVTPHRNATMVDERYAVTERENEEILKTYFNQGPDGPLREFPRREKRKLVILRHLARQFAENRAYTEKEVNERLKERYPDYVTLRRYLIEYGFMDREPDGSLYWIKRGEKGNEIMDKMRKKELATAYAQSYRAMGVYQIRNTANGKIFVDGTMDLDGARNRLAFAKQMNMNSLHELKEDWAEYGPDRFEFEELDRIKPKDEAPPGPEELKAYKEEVGALLELWLEKLQPYGDKGYNKKRRKQVIR